MRTAVALTSVPTAPRHRDGDDLIGQMPLPLPGAAAVLPVPRTRDDDARVRELRAPVARFMQGLTEVLAGGRPAHQVRPWMTPDVHDQLVRRLHAGTRRRTGPRAASARIASVHVSPCGPQAVEVAGRMVHQGRSRAIAVRLELRASHRGAQVWTCTALVWA